MPKQNKHKDKSSSDDRDINRSPIRELPKTRSEQADKIIALIKKIDQKTMIHDNKESYTGYLLTVEKRLSTYDETNSDKFIDYVDKKSKAHEKTKEKGRRKSSRSK